MRVEQVHEPIAPGPRLRDQQEELFRRRHRRVRGGVQDEPQWGFHLPIVVAVPTALIFDKPGYVGDTWAYSVSL